MLCVNEDANVIYISISQCEASSNKMREREVISEKENKLVLGGKPLFGVCVLPLMLKGSADSGAFFHFPNMDFFNKRKGCDSSHEKTKAWGNCSC